MNASPPRLICPVFRSSAAHPVAACPLKLGIFALLDSAVHSAGHQLDYIIYRGTKSNRIPPKGKAYIPFNTFQLLPILELESSYLTQLKKNFFIPHDLPQSIQPNAIPTNHRNLTTSKDTQSTQPQ
ncbi:hypothetical protein CEXT_425151 [Caerostris extrusa]|uniref:Uncharacterized protein n=1 Tax=Caerostris extrusa TaxID=172846 RepID=A0AAV4QZR4_CAEEX|nr:hypothetical protein CEXT_425151 [Caerostris extrusa]